MLYYVRTVKDINSSNVGGDVKVVIPAHSMIVEGDDIIVGSEYLHEDCKEPRRYRVNKKEADVEHGDVILTCSPYTKKNKDGIPPSQIVKTIPAYSYITVSHGLDLT